MKRNSDNTASSARGGTGPPAKQVCYRTRQRWKKRGAFDIDKLNATLKYSSDESSDEDNGDQCNDFSQDSDPEDRTTIFIPDVVQIPQDSSSESDSPDSSSDQSEESKSDENDCDEGSAPTEDIPHSFVRSNNDGDENMETDCGPLLGNQGQLHSFTETTVDEAVLGLMSSFLQHKKTYSCLKTDMEVVLSVLPQPYLMPTSVFLLLKYVNQYSPQTAVTAFYCCKYCQLYYGTTAKECPDCEDNGYIKFYMLDIADQIKFLFEHRGLADLLKKAVEKRNVDSNVIGDITDGSVYKRANVNRKEFDLTLILSVDGALIKRSSKADFWPITFTIAELPPAVRNYFITIVGIWYSKKKKPEMNTFFRPLVIRLLKLKKQGGLQWTNPKTGEHCSSKISSPILTPPCNIIRSPGRELKTSDLRAAV